MEVTTFVEEEKVSLIADPDQWKDKVTELGLKGQEAILSSGHAANPFLLMTAGMVNTFTCLCSTKQDINEYDHEPIPLKALMAYGLAVKEKYFKVVTIWFSPTSSDPIMVGTDAQNNRFLMAQWGPERYDYSALRRRAIETFRPVAIAAAKREMKCAAEKLEDMDNMLERHFNGEWVAL